MSKEQLLFKTPYGERKRHYTESGKELQNEYGYEINKLGQKVLVKTGEFNLYQKIQEAHEDTKIENVMARCIAGDTSMLRPDGLYADATKAPKNLIEARQQMQTLENLWNSLDINTRRKYNFSVDEFIGASGTTEWLKDMGMIKEVAKEVSENMKTKTTEPEQVLKTTTEEAKGDN